NGQDVQGATGPVWSANTLNDNDSISVEVISSYRCPQPIDAKSNGIRVHVLTGVGDMNQPHGFALYPNPNNGSFILTGKLHSDKPVQLDIINAVGQVVLSKTITANTGELNEEIQLNNVANGIYLLRININGETTAMRFRVAR
ncbi:MAG TPA: T9SS type A sorting domain-containing protein, partial [Flavipsychrobacter sp.]